MANAYALGAGVPQNPGTAVYWWQLAADQGNQAAQISLGNAYLTGQGVNPDAQKSAYWMMLATAPQQQASMSEGPLPYHIAAEQAAPLAPNSTYQHMTPAHHRRMKAVSCCRQTFRSRPLVAFPAKRGKPLAVAVNTELTGKPLAAPVHKELTGKPLAAPVNKELTGKSLVVPANTEVTGKSLAVPANTELQPSQ